MEHGGTGCVSNFHIRELSIYLAQKQITAPAIRLARAIVVNSIRAMEEFHSKMLPSQIKPSEILQRSHPMIFYGHKILSLRKELITMADITGTAFRRHPEYKSADGAIPLVRSLVDEGAWYPFACR